VLTLPAGSGDDAERAAPVPANWRGTVLEKPVDKADQLWMLADLNGNACEVITGVAVVYPVLVSPGYEIKCMEERSIVYFVDHKPSVLKAYVDSGEGVDRAGGFAIQVCTIFFAY
jgi:septum formation protein